MNSIKIVSDELFVHQNTHMSDVSLLHFSARHRCHHQGVRSVANLAPSEWFVV